MEDGVGELNLAQSALVEMMFHNFSKFGVPEQWMCCGSCTQNVLNMCVEHSLHAWCSVFVGKQHDILSMLPCEVLMGNRMTCHLDATMQPSDGG